MADRKLQLFIALQVLIPLALLIARLIEGRIVRYGWGWQMYS